MKTISFKATDAEYDYLDWLVQTGKAKSASQVIRDGINKDAELRTDVPLRLTHALGLQRIRGRYAGMQRFDERRFKDQHPELFPGSTEPTPAAAELLAPAAQIAAEPEPVNDPSVRANVQARLEEFARGTRTTKLGRKRQPKQPKSSPYTPAAARENLKRRRTQGTPAKATKQKGQKPATSNGATKKRKES